MMASFIFDEHIIIVLDKTPCYSHTQITLEKNMKNSCDVNVLQSSSSYRRCWKRGILSPDVLENTHQNSSTLLGLRDVKKRLH